MRLFDDQAAGLRGKAIALYALLIAANLAAWAWAFAVFRDDAVLLGTALLAYGLGLRHAVDVHGEHTNHPVNRAGNHDSTSSARAAHLPAHS